MICALGFTGLSNEILVNNELIILVIKLFSLRHVFFCVAEVDSSDSEYWFITCLPIYVYIDIDIFSIIASIYET